MASHGIVRFLIAAHTAAAALGANLAHADETSAPVAVAVAPAAAAPAPIMFSANVGYQFSNQDVLTGLVDSLVLGIQVRSPRASRRDYLDIGVAQLDTDEPAALPYSYVLVGGRSAWRWDRFGLQLFGHLRHGDRASDGDLAIGSRSASGGAIASWDLWRRPFLSLAIGLHATGNIYQTRDGEDRSVAASGSTGLSVIAW